MVKMFIFAAKSMLYSNIYIVIHLKIPLLMTNTFIHSAYNRDYCFRHGLLLLMLLLQICFNEMLAGNKKKCPEIGVRLTPQQYCDKYSELARREMLRYGVPASITLAQGMLESTWGASYLANEANNHFGIKALSRGWTGPVVLCDDDNIDDPFCKFSSVEEGYSYHSTFLKNNSRYARLFELDIRDYESWAYGLRECGYATDPNYGKKLIKLIQENHLDAYDVVKTEVIYSQRQLFRTKEKGGLKYVRCLPGDDISAIAKQYGIKVSKLRYWNDMTKQSVLKENDIIYLQNKKTKAEKGHEYHIVKSGESMWSISQLYGVRVLSIMKRNKLVSATVHQGQVLYLR